MLTCALWFFFLLDRCPKWCYFSDIDIDAAQSHATSDATANIRWNQRATGVSLLQANILLLLLTQKTLPRQTRAVWHALRVRILSPAIPHEKLPDNAQKPTAPWLERNAQAITKNIRHQECPWTACAATSAAPSVRLCCRVGPTATRDSPIKETQSIIAITNALSDELNIDGGRSATNHRLSVGESRFPEGRQTGRETKFYF